MLTLTAGQKISLLLGITALVCGISLLFMATSLIEYVTTSFFILKPTSYLKSLWYKSVFPIVTDIYFFNWTNPKDFYDHSIKPKFEETGPYRFLQDMEKVNLTWNNNNTVSFRLMKTFYLDEQNTPANVSDIVTTLNFITWILADVIQKESNIVKKGVSLVLDSASAKVYLRKPVYEYIYGVDDFFLDIAHTIPFIFSQFPRYEKTGVLSVMNRSIDFSGYISVATGMNGNFNVQNWNHYTTTPFHKKPCGMVQGTLGDLYGRNLSKDFIVLFVPELCRYIKMVYKNDVTVKGILGYKYIIGKEALDNGTNVPENRCFCDGECIPSGMISMSSCRFGIPAFLSLPHFYQADFTYQDAVEGLQPEEAKHEGYIVVEPMTGFPIEVSVGMQLNLRMQPVEAMDLYEDIRKMYFPLCWVKQSAIIPDNYALLLKVYLYLPYGLKGFAGLLIILGFSLLLLQIVVIKNVQNTNEWFTYNKGKAMTQSKQEQSLLLIT